VPFLVSFPSLLSLNGFSSSREAGAMAAAYLTGCTGYAVAGLVLYRRMIGRFDKHVGRIPDQQA
jgi:hypothetical protein